MPHAQPYSVAESFFLDLAHTLARQGKSHNNLKVRGTNPRFPGELHGWGSGENKIKLVGMSERTADPGRKGYGQIGSFGGQPD